MAIVSRVAGAIVIFLATSLLVWGQATQLNKAEAGSQTAKNGFRNESEIAAKFQAWQRDPEARIWLQALGYKRLEDILSVTATKPHGEKADVLVRVKTSDGSEKAHGISIKLVSSENGFNQIDKRWLAHYAKMWKMPADVEVALKLFVGETSPTFKSRVPGRMFLDEISAADRRGIVDFFAANKDKIVSSLFAGDGAYRADWIMVAQKSSAKPRWILRRIDYAIKLFGAGDVALTSHGNLKIGRITMQRKGGDGGRESAKMLQFKINPALLFDIHAKL